MTENEKPKRDYLKWWLIIISIVSAAFIVMFTDRVGGPINIIVSAIVILINVMTWITWKKENETSNVDGLMVWLIILTIISGPICVYSSFWVGDSPWLPDSISDFLFEFFRFLLTPTMLFLSWITWRRGRRRLSIILSVITALLTLFLIFLIFIVALI